MFKIVAAMSGLMLLGAFPYANAATDLFECRAKIVDLKTGDSVESVGSAAGYRMVTPNSPGGQPYPPDVEVTRSEAKLSIALEGRATSYKVDFNLHYGFAKRPIGNPTEARQYICDEVLVQSCQNNSCSSANSVCFTMPDPFDSKFGWNSTSLSQNVPVFNEQLLRPLDTIIPLGPNDPNGARATVSCKFLGTYL